jgi:hypothetical protein
MRQLSLIFVIAISVMNCLGQEAKKQNELLTYKFGGSYGYGGNRNHPTGNLIIYPESDSTVLFYLSASRGKPSFNSGSLYGRMKVIQSEGYYSNNLGFSEKNCRLSFQFLPKSIVVKTIEDAGGCGFGYGVQSDGTFKKISSYIPKYFETIEGEQMFFEDLGLKK